MSNELHGLTYKDESGKTVAHPLYWVWHEKKKKYAMVPDWEEDVAEFVSWAESKGWVRGDSIRRFYVQNPYGPVNCYVHVRGTPLGTVK